MPGAVGMKSHQDLLAATRRRSARAYAKEGCRGCAGCLKRAGREEFSGGAVWHQLGSGSIRVSSSGLGLNWSASPLRVGAQDAEDDCVALALTGRKQRIRWVGHGELRSACAANARACCSVGVAGTDARAEEAMDGRTATVLLWQVVISTGARRMAGLPVAEEPRSRMAREAPDLDEGADLHDQTPLKYKQAGSATERTVLVGFGWTLPAHGAVLYRPEWAAVDRRPQPGRGVRVPSAQRPPGRASCHCINWHCPRTRLQS